MAPFTQLVPHGCGTSNISSCFANATRVSTATSFADAAHGAVETTPFTYNDSHEPRYHWKDFLYAICILCIAFSIIITTIACRMAVRAELNWVGRLDSICAKKLRAAFAKIKSYVRGSESAPGESESVTMVTVPTGTSTADGVGKDARPLGEPLSDNGLIVKPWILPSPECASQRKIRNLYD